MSDISECTGRIAVTMRASDLSLLGQSAGLGGILGGGTHEAPACGGMGSAVQTARFLSWKCTGFRCLEGFHVQPNDAEQPACCSRCPGFRRRHSIWG